MVKLLLPTTAACITTVVAAFGPLTDFPDDMAVLVDPSIDPCEDFIHYACGEWLHTHDIPPTKSSVEYARDQIVDSMYSIVDAILASEKPLVGDFYASCMDATTRNDLSVAPLVADLEAIRGAKVFTTLSLAANKVNVMLNGSAAYLALSGDFPTGNYLTNAALWASIELEYLTYVSTLLTLASMSNEDAVDAQAKVIAFEPALKFSDGTHPNQKLIRQRGSKVPPLCRASAPQHECGTPQARTEYHFLHAAAPRLTDEFERAHTVFWKVKIIGGNVDQFTPHQVCRKDAHTLLGEVAGQYFLDEAWLGETAEAAETLVQSVQAALQAELESAVWLDNPTRAYAKTKLAKLIHLLGGPTNPQLYPDVTIDAGAYANNGFEIQHANTRQFVAKVGAPVDRSKWVNTAQKPNESNIYAPTSSSFSRPSSYGSAVGHELSHGFDAAGAQYDIDGNRKTWWTPAVSANFAANDTTPAKLLGTNVNGKNSIRETVWDNTGLRTAFRAYKELMKTAESEYTEATGEKMFFLGFAQTWCEKRTDTSYIQMIKNDGRPHENVHVIGAKTRRNLPVRFVARLTRR
ncbi:Aste57867_10410 [Aphanomyces stellatus]|uniref:Aste57867_10410 protein n=1 Tax=Aphanomyces stellatus TaxID=120398 RepID=A0A485KQA0_9STRA|nr:hypothetical protein As57867_010370 [Aphanomyces stellatus]VFT87284.1 Aste57867_10410 [Aphanomyces stellatus]